MTISVSISKDGEVIHSDETSLEEATFVIDPSVPEEGLSVPEVPVLPICGGDGDKCYDDAGAMAVGFAFTPRGKLLEYVFANGTSGLKVWKALGSKFILQADGSDFWAKNLNANGKGRSTTNFIDTDLGTESTLIVGRVCPPNVYIGDSNKFATSNCLYYTADQGQLDLKELGNKKIHPAPALPTYPWGDSDDNAQWYAGNITACSDLGMRLPTIYETNASKIGDTSHYPIGNPIFAQSSGTGVPSTGAETWTASSYTNYGVDGEGDDICNGYWVWKTEVIPKGNYGENLQNIKCVLP